ncbi:MAG TPA: hypothetical protein VFJ01_10610 [Oleiagrimonas sp.]|nr:hypothetical protein [Oleiagrimonas sp.]
MSRTPLRASDNLDADDRRKLQGHRKKNLRPVYLLANQAIAAFHLGSDNTNLTVGRLGSPWPMPWIAAYGFLTRINADEHGSKAFFSIRVHRRDLRPHALLSEDEA